MRRPFIATGKQLGEGMFGVVMSGTAKGLVPGEPSTRVAVKHLSDESRFFLFFFSSPLLSFFLRINVLASCLCLQYTRACACVPACMRTCVCVRVRVPVFSSFILIVGFAYTLTLLHGQLYGLGTESADDFAQEIKIMKSLAEASKHTVDTTGPDRVPRLPSNRDHGIPHHCLIPNVDDKPTLQCMLTGVSF